MPSASQLAWKGSVREVSAYSTVGPQFAWEAARRRHLATHNLKMAFDRIPQGYRKACNLPLLPQLGAASCHSTSVSSSIGRARTAKSFSRYAPYLDPSVLARSVLRRRRLRLVGAHLSCLKRSRQGCPA